MRKVLIGTPLYDGKPTMYYVYSLVRTLRAAPKDMYVDFLFVGYDALVQRARNDLLAAAIGGDVDDLVFIDGDQSWEPSWFYALLEHKVDVVGLPVPKKSDVEQYNVKCASHRPEVGPNGLIQVDGIGTGFTRLSKAALRLAWDSSEAYVENGKERRMAFDVVIRDGSLVSEDNVLCDKLGKLGIYVDPRFTVPHVGHKVYTGNFGPWLAGVLKAEDEYQAAMTAKQPAASSGFQAPSRGGVQGS